MFKSFLQRFTNSNGRQKSKRRVTRSLRMERLDRRAVLAADIGAITGTVYKDLDGDGLDATDERLAGVDVTLFRDGGNGVFGGDDTLVGTDTSDALASATPGQYRFDNLSPGRYFVQQVNATAPAGLTNPAVATVNIVTGSVRVAAIDLFNQTPVATLLANSATPVTSNTSAIEAIGGQRNITLTRTGVGGNVTLDIVPGATAADPGVLAVGSSVSPGTALIQYDGDNLSTLNPTGLAGADLSASDTRAGLVFEIDSAVPAVGGGIDIRIYTSATNFSIANVTFPAAANPGPVTVFVPFTSFATDALGGATGPADFTNVGAFEETITVIADQDVRVSLVESARPETVTADLRNFQPLTIGDLVFQDNNNDGLFNNADAGIVGVDVQLFKLATSTSVVNPATDTLIGTQTTGAGGAYSFTGVEPGFYAIVIPATEFGTGATLQGFQTSTPNPETAGANADVNNDDDGRAVTGQSYIASGVITLISGAEPGAGGNLNNTFDFGFVSNADLGITKGDATITVDANGVRTATFRIDVVNNGPLTATGISVVDSLPIGFTFVNITQVPTIPLTVTGTPTTTGTPATGQAVTINLNNLNSSGGTSFNIVATIGSTVFGDQTNSATVDGDQTDTVAGNNTDTGLVDLPVTDLSITKTLETTTGNVIPPATAQTGDTVVYRIIVKNDAANSAAIDDVATGVSVSDTLPVGVTFVSGTVNGVALPANAFNTTTRVVTAPVGTVTRGTDAVILLRVTVDSNSGSPIANAATVTNLPDTDNVTTNDTANVSNNVTRAVDLAVVKSVSTTVGDSTTAVFGAPITFVITVTNTTTSPGDSRGFTVTDTLPTGLTLVANSFNAGTSGVTIANTGQALTFTGGVLAVGQSVSFKYNATVAQNAGTTITNSASVAPINTGGITDVDNIAGNNTENEVLTPARNVDLVVTKDDGIAANATGTPGNTITYSIVVTNTGTSDAVNVNVTDTLPAGVTATSITLNGAQVTDNDPATGVVAFVLPSIPTGAANAVTVLLTGTIAASTTGTITNSVAITGGGLNDPPAGNSATVATPLAAVFDVGIVKTGPATAIPGSTTNISYTLAVTNPTGPSNSPTVTVTDTLPTGVTFQSATLNGTAVTPTIVGQVLTFTIPTIAVGTTGNQSIVINARVTDAALTASLVNTATVAAIGDTNAANNTSSLTTTLTPQADITVTNTPSSTTASPGGSLTYTIVVSNAGPSTALGVTLVDTLPTGFTFVSGTGPNGQVLTATGQTVNATVGTLAPAATQTYTVTGTIASTFTGTLTNNATVATTSNEGANTLVNTAAAAATVANGSIAGRVFRDQNGNGTFDARDVGIAGVAIALRQRGQTTNLQTTTTAADGTYTFSNVAAGDFDIVETQPAASTGVVDGLEQAGSTATPAQTTNDTIPLTLTAGQAATVVNFAEVEPLSKRRFLASS